MQDLSNIGTRPWRYHNADGINELLMGITWIIWGGALLAGGGLEQGSLRKVYWTVVPLVLVCSGFWSSWLAKRMRERFTYARAGYMEPKAPGIWVKILTACIAIAVSGGIVVLARSAEAHGVERAGVAGTGFLVAVAFLIPAVRMKAPQYLILSAVSIGLAGWLYQSAAAWDGLSWFFLWLGMASATVGVYRLMRFVRDNPLLAGEHA